MVDRRRKRGQPAPYQPASDRFYVARLREFGRRTADEVWAAIQEPLADMVRAQELARSASATTAEIASWTRTDAADGLPRDLERAIEGVRVRLGEIVPVSDVEEATSTTFSQTEAHNAREVARVVPIDLWSDTPLGPVADQFTQENLALIRSLQGRILGNVSDIIAQALREGWTVEEIRAALIEAIGVDPDDPDAYKAVKVQADRIARDQVGKLFGRLTKERHVQAGITRYRWSTSRDDAVRKTHAELHGVIFAYPGHPGPRPPRGEDPGEAIQCRCVAVPVLTSRMTR